MPSFSQVFHHSLFTIEPLSAVGFCIHCAFHLLTGKEAFTDNSSSFFQNSDHKGSSESGIIAGNSTTSHWSACVSDCLFNNLPAKSLVLHLVITKTIVPPGCNLCLGPEVYHSHAASIAVGDIASCSECGSSIINKSAPRPVIAPPTPE